MGKLHLRRIDTLEGYILFAGLLVLLVVSRRGQGHLYAVCVVLVWRGRGCRGLALLQRGLVLALAVEQVNVDGCIQVSTSGSDNCPNRPLSRVKVSAI